MSETLRKAYDRGWREAEAHYHATALVRAAKAVIARVDRNLDTESEPFKWVAPWRELTRLRDSLHAINTAEKP